MPNVDINKVNEVMFQFIGEYDLYAFNNRGLFEILYVKYRLIDPELVTDELLLIQSSPLVSLDMKENPYIIAYNHVKSMYFSLTHYLFKVELRETYINNLYSMQVWANTKPEFATTIHEYELEVREIQ